MTNCSFDRALISNANFSGSTVDVAALLEAADFTSVDLSFVGGNPELTAPSDSTPRRIVSAFDAEFSLDRLGNILWRGDSIGHLVRGDNVLNPRVLLNVACDEQEVDMIQSRVAAWLNTEVTGKLEALVNLKAAIGLDARSKNIAHLLVDQCGLVERSLIRKELGELDQVARKTLRAHGVRFGAFNVFIPTLLKPGARQLTFALRNVYGQIKHISAGEMPDPPRAGLTSVPVVRDLSGSYYNASGFQICGPRAVRVDILERLADVIRPLVAFRGGKENGAHAAPDGATGDGGFTINPVMMSLLGCGSIEVGGVLSSLGFAPRILEVVPGSMYEHLRRHNILSTPPNGTAKVHEGVPTPDESASDPDGGSQADNPPFTLEIWRPKRRKKAKT